MYANGAWIKNTPIPPSESNWGIGKMVQEEIYKRILLINEQSAKAGAAIGTNTQKIGDFWKAAMDTNAINRAGLTTLKNHLKKIDKIESANELTAIAAAFHIDGINCFFNGQATQDDKNSNLIIYKMEQGGLGLPNREYYFKTDDRTSHIRDEYKKYMVLTFEQLGMSNSFAEKCMTDVFELEKKLATASRKLEDLRDPYANYNKITINQLDDICNTIYWNDYAKKIGIENTLDSIVVGQPEFFTALGNEIKNTEITVWKNYLKFHLVQSFASYLDNVTYSNAFNFRKLLTGAKEPRPRWKRVLDAEENAMGELLGQLFVKEYFNAAVKQRYSKLVEAIKAVYADRIKKLDWMSDDTKQKALYKLGKLSKKVGYPDKWKNYSSLEVTPSSYLNNIISANIFEHYYNIKKLGKPVDRAEWEMTPQTYNAYYNPSNNEIVLPAGIFAVPGIKDEALDDAFIYGYAAASTIGHEMTHGFDDQGRQYDAAGNLNDWWTKEDVAAFNQRATGIIDQFNAFIPVDTLHINGDATQGENIADLGGLLLGLDAFKKTTQYKEGKLIGGLTPLQRYFLAYAYSWMWQEKKERLALQVMTDIHAPAKERVNGPLVNIAEFYEAFGIKNGTKMPVPENERVVIW
ncbi:MAG: M13 family metallopeptidase [Chitinophagaceae bacterium]|nr:M13 family metallopeptidase [Chitinophagaceae bacterium]